MKPVSQSTFFQTFSSNVPSRLMGDVIRSQLILRCAQMNMNEKEKKSKNEFFTPLNYTYIENEMKT